MAPERFLTTNQTEKEKKPQNVVKTHFVCNLEFDREHKEISSPNIG